MRKIRKRVFAVVLAAALLFTMPGMASYAKAEDAKTEYISESVTVQTEDDAAEGTGAETEAIKEPKAEDSDTDQPETGEDDTGDTETDAQEPAEEETVPTQKEDADLSRCKGEKTENSSEEKKEDVGQGDTGAQDDSANLCAHHKEHMKDCGYSRASEDGEGSPCSYECKFCPIEDLIAALPDEVTEDNAEKVRAQLNKILALYRELTAEEQEQIDISRCLELQEALDAANAPTPIEEPSEDAVAMVEKEGEEPSYVTSLADAFVAGNSGATVTLLKSVNLGSEELAIPNDTEFTLEGSTYEITSSSSATVVLGFQSTFTLLSGTLSNTNTLGAAVQLNNSNAAFTMSSGTVNGTYSAVNCIYPLSSVNISGGAVNGGEMGLNAPTATVKLSGGTYSSIYVGGKTVANILADGCALQVGDRLISRDTSLSGRQNDVKVVNPCPHTGVFEDKGDGTHGATTEDGNCPYCGTEFEAAPHTLGADNKCEGCGTPLVASVKIDSDITYYGGIGPAWTAALGKTATVTLLADVTHPNMLNISDSSDNITLNGGDYTLSIQGFLVNGGQLNIIGGTFIGNSTVLMVLSGTVNLSGGEFRCNDSAHTISCATVTVASLLSNYGSTNAVEKHYAYYRDGGPISLVDGSGTLFDTVKVQECDHTGVDPTPNNGTHTLKCPYCGYTGPAEDCSYGTEYQHDDTNHWQTCTVCGYENKEAHTLKLAVQANGTVITASDACNCGYQKDLGNVTLTVPTNLIYHDGQTIAWTASDGLSLSFKWDASGDGFTVQPISVAGLDTGEHMLNIEVSHDSQKASSSIPVTVKPATLTAAMVTVAPESVTYSGAEQKPAITVKQGDNALAVGTDYDITYSTTDFTNVGTVIITIKGKGNYTGTAEKTYTIKKAVLTATGTSTANGTYGTKLSELSVTGLKAVFQGGATEVSGTWKLTGDTIPNVGDSGKYTATFTPASGAGNYETLTAQVTLKIEKAAAPKPQAGTLYVQNNREQSYQYDLTQLLPALDNGKSYGTVSYTLEENAVNISGGYYKDGAKITGTTLTLPIQKVDGNKEGDIGTIKIMITSGNYEGMAATITVKSINQAPVTITGVSVAEREYNGNAIERTGTPKAVESDGSTAVINGNDFRYTWQTADGKDLSGAPKDAGSYLLTVSVDNGTYIGTSTISFVINKAAITITANSMTVNKGSAKPALTYTISGLAEKEALAVEPTLTCNADMNTAGRYPITVSGAEVPDSNNYHTEITYVPGALTVTASTSDGSSDGGNGGGDRGNDNGNGSGSENNGDGGQGNSSDNGGGNTTPGVPSVPAVVDTNPGTDTETTKPGTRNTARLGTGTEPESGTAKEERPDTGIPFIKGEDGKTGWNVIRDEEEKAEEGSVINVDMNGTAVVPGDIFDSIKGRDITIIFDMCNGIVWSVDGKSITTDKADDIDFTVRTGGSTIPVEIVSNVIGEHYSIQLSLAHDGEFGFIAVLSVGIGEENAGYLASLYYYNEDAGELEFICADEVAQDGTVSFAFTHASDYVVVVDREVEKESGTEETAQPEGTDSAQPQDRADGNGGTVMGSPEKGQNRTLTGLILTGIIALAGIGAGIFTAVKKKKEKEKY